jgi:hypothetical protein
MDIDDLELMSRDDDWTVRYEVAMRANPELLEHLLLDSDDEVRAVAEQRSALTAMELEQHDT